MSYAAPKVRTQLPPTTIDDTPIPETEQRAHSYSRKISTYQFAILGGWASGNLLEKDETLNSLSYGLRLSYLPDLQTQWDLDTLILKEKTLSLFAAKSFACCLATADHLYYKLGAGTYLDTSDGLANIAELRRWKVRAGFGSHDLLNLDRYLQAEIGAGLGLNGPEVYALIAINFNLAD